MKWRTASALLAKPASASRWSRAFLNAARAWAAPPLRLIVLDRQEVVAAGGDDRGADVAVGEHRVAGDDLAGQRQHAQQLQRRLVLVGLAVDAQLAQHG